MRKIFLFLIFWFIPGCYIVNTVHINVYPDGGMSVSFVSAGDSVDVFNRDFPHPSESGPFVRETKAEIDGDGEPFWVMTTRGYLEMGANLVFDVERPVMTPIDFKRDEGWLSINYSFTQAFLGFGLSKKYPAFIRAYENNTIEDTLAWLPEYHNYSIRAALVELSLEMEELQAPGMVDRLSNHVTNHFNYVVESEKQLLPIIPATPDLKRLFSPFLDQLPPSFILSLHLALKPYQEELRHVTDLKGEVVNFSLVMPGVIMRSNADSTSGDTMKWIIDMEDILDEARLVRAHTITFKKNNIRTMAFIFATLAAVVLLGSYSIRKRRQKGS